MIDNTLVHLVENPHTEAITVRALVPADSRTALETISAGADFGRYIPQDYLKTLSPTSPADQLWVTYKSPACEETHQGRIVGAAFTREGILPLVQNGTEEAVVLRARSKLLRLEGTLASASEKNLLRPVYLRDTPVACSSLGGSMIFHHGDLIIQLPKHPDHWGTGKRYSMGEYRFANGVIKLPRDIREYSLKAGDKSDIFSVRIAQGNWRPEHINQIEFIPALES